MLAALTLFFAFTGLFTAAYHDPEPHEVPVAVVGSGRTAEEVQAGLDRSSAGAFNVERYASEAAAREDLLDTEVQGVLVAGQTGDRALVTGPYGKPPTDAVRGAFEQVAAARGAQLEVDDLRPLPAHDSRGLSSIGLEYASMAGALGVHVTVVERRGRLLEFIDAEIVDALQHALRDLGVTLRLGEQVSVVERRADGAVVTRLKSGKRIPSDVVLYAAGRQGATAELGLGAAGLEADARGRIHVDADYRTAQPHIFAVGDVIGFPALAATSME